MVVRRRKQEFAGVRSWAYRWATVPSVSQDESRAQLVNPGRKSVPIGSCRAVHWMKRKKDSIKVNFMWWIGTGPVEFYRFLPTLFSSLSFSRRFYFSIILIVFCSDTVGFSVHFYSHFLLLMSSINCIMVRNVIAGRLSKNSENTQREKSFAGLLSVA